MPGMKTPRSSIEDNLEDLHLEDLHGSGMSPRRGQASRSPSPTRSPSPGRRKDSDLNVSFAVPDVAMPGNFQALMDGQKKLEVQTQQLVASVTSANVLMQGQMRLAKQLEQLSQQIHGGGGLRERMMSESAADGKPIPRLHGDIEDGISHHDPTGSPDTASHVDEDEAVDMSEVEDRVTTVRRVMKLISLRHNDTTRSIVLHGHTRLHFAAWVAEVLTCIAFTLACGVMLALWARHVNEEAFVNTFFVTAIAAMTYFAKSCHMGDFMFKGQVVPFARYIDWVTTTPLMLYEVCHIAHAPASMTTMVIVCDLLMLATGLIAASVPWKPYKGLKQVWFFFSCLFYILMVIVLQVDVAYKASKQVETAATLFKRLEVLTVVVWSFYPIIVGMGRAHLGLITKPMEDILLCILDVTAKIGMEGLIVYSCFNGCLGEYGGAH